MSVYSTHGTIEFQDREQRLLVIAMQDGAFVFLLTPYARNPWVVTIDAEEAAFVSEITTESKARLSVDAGEGLLNFIPTAAGEPYRRGRDISLGLTGAASAEASIFLDNRDFAELKGFLTKRLQLQGRAVHGIPLPPA